MNMAKTTTAPTITYASSSVFERAPEGDISYKLWQRLCDAWAGWIDRSSLDTSDSEAASPWLQRLHWECTNRLEAEHRATVASLAFQDQKIVQLRESIATAQDTVVAMTAEVDARTARLADDESAPISDEPTTLAEQGDPRSVVHKRHAQRRAADLQPKRDALKGLEDEVADVRNSINQDKISLQMTITDRHSLWSILMVRSAHLIAHYNRRASTYVRVAARRNGEFVSSPSVPQPDWLSRASIPSIPDLEAAMRA